MPQALIILDTFSLSLFENLIRMETFSGFKFPKGEIIKETERVPMQALAWGDASVCPAALVGKQQPSRLIVWLFPSFPGLHVHP